MSVDQSGLIDINQLSKEVMDISLGPYVRFDPQRKEFVYTTAWYALDNRRKIIAYLVARKGTLVQKLVDDVEAASPKTIIEDTGLPAGSVRPVLAAMYKAREVEKDQDGRYFVPNRSLLRVKEMFLMTNGGNKPPPKPRPGVRRKVAKRI